MGSDTSEPESEASAHRPQIQPGERLGTSASRVTATKSSSEAEQKVGVSTRPHWTQRSWPTVGRSAKAPRPWNTSGSSSSPPLPS
eukprot:14546407-Alexandrium_andersonii.AAC.1